MNRFKDKGWKHNKRLNALYKRNNKLGRAIYLIVVIGGAFQGKLDYVKNEYGVVENDIFYCGENQPLDFSKEVIYGFHLYIYDLIRQQSDNQGQAAVNYEQMAGKLMDKIIICDDISSGIVPIDPIYRKWREETGKSMKVLCSAAQKVIRVFCGMGTVVKHV